MQAVSFQNPGIIDLRAVKTFGVSVKTGEQPIGFFGTGLKYAIAILLRTGHEIELWRGTERHSFGVSRVEVRGESFDVVTFDGEEIGMTTQVGKTWKLWQALREMHCNTTDENGESHSGVATPKDNHTTIIVHGQAFAKEFEKLNEVILPSKPLLTIGALEIHPGAGYHFYYRGVRVHDLPKPSLYTYNITSACDLTEDRTLKYHFQAVWAVAGGILKCTNEAMLRDILSAGGGKYESDLNYSDPPELAGNVFLDVAGQLRREMNENLNDSARKIHIQRTGEDSRFDEMPLTALERSELNDCIKFCEDIGFNISKYPVFVSESLGKGTLGLALKPKQQIWLSRHCLMMGRRMVIGTLLEEFLHLAHGLEDESRAMQNFLFDLVVTFAERANKTGERT